MEKSIEVESVGGRARINGDCSVCLDVRSISYDLQIKGLVILRRIGLDSFQAVSITCGEVRSIYQQMRKKL